VADANRALKGPAGLAEESKYRGESSARKKRLADKTSEEKPVMGKVIPFRRRSRANPRPRRPGVRGAKPPTELVVSVELILSRLGLCGAD
jgi:hypothetical protein